MSRLVSDIDRWRQISSQIAIKAGLSLRQPFIFPLIVYLAETGLMPDLSHTGQIPSQLPITSMLSVTIEIKANC